MTAKVNVYELYLQMGLSLQMHLDNLYKIYLRYKQVKYFR